MPHAKPRSGSDHKAHRHAQNHGEGTHATMLFLNSSVTSAPYQRVLLQCFSFKCYQISEPGQVNKSCYSAVNSTAKKLVRF